MAGEDERGTVEEAAGKTGEVIDDPEGFGAAMALG